MKDTRSVRFAHLSNTAVNKESGKDPSEFTLRASVVIPQICVPRLQPRIDEVCRAAIVGIFPTIMHNLPKRCDLIEELPKRQDSKIATLRKAPGELRRPVAPAQPVLRPALPPLGPAGRASRLSFDIRPRVEAGRALPMAKRFWHILGIDVIVDREGNPQVLELNDRPSLSVTVPFEQELKESLIAEAFEHVGPDGEVNMLSPISRWRCILPDPAWTETIARITRRDFYLQPITAQVEHTARVLPVLPRKPRRRKKEKENAKGAGRRQRRRDGPAAPEVDVSTAPAGTYRPIVVGGDACA